jgi:hypothetical protein
MTEARNELTAEELEAEAAGKLPDRQAMTTLGDLPTGLLPDSLLDLDVNVDLDADVAAPIDAAIAANANVAAPIDAAVSANVLSPGSASVANAVQTSTIVQDLDGVAEADATQSSDISQGDTETDSTTGA